MNRKLIFGLFSAVFLMTAASSKADPAKAEDEAYKMAVRYTQLGFAMSPTNHSGLGGSGFTVRFLIPVSKGLDYVFLVGGDLAARDIDIYVYDEVGSLILDDRRGDPRAGVKFRSSYNGTTQVYLHMARANGLAAYSVLVGRRGVDKSYPALPNDPTSDAVGK
jgi:hypothetical protein